MSTKTAAAWRVPTKLTMAKELAEHRAQAYTLDELIEIAAEIEEAHILKLPLTIVRRDYEQMTKEGLPS